MHEAFLNYPKGRITGDYQPPAAAVADQGRTQPRRARQVRAAVCRRRASTWKTRWKPFFVMASDFSAGSEEVLDAGRWCATSRPASPSRAPCRRCCVDGQSAVRRRHVQQSAGRCDGRAWAWARSSPSTSPGDLGPAARPADAPRRAGAAARPAAAARPSSATAGCRRCPRR